METRVSFTCPYCQFINSDVVEVSSLNQRKVVVCSVDDGGCDRPFAVEFHFSFTYTTSYLEYLKPSEHTPLERQLKEEQQLIKENDFSHRGFLNA